MRAAGAVRENDGRTRTMDLVVELEIAQLCRTQIRILAERLFSGCRDCECRRSSSDVLQEVSADDLFLHDGFSSRLPYGPVARNCYDQTPPLVKSR
jgi:hypothetical protein